MNHSPDSLPFGLGMITDACLKKQRGEMDYVGHILSFIIWLKKKKITLNWKISCFQVQEKSLLSIIYYKLDQI